MALPSPYGRGHPRLTRSHMSQTRQRGTQKEASPPIPSPCPTTIAVRMVLHHRSKTKLDEGSTHPSLMKKGVESLLRCTKKLAKCVAKSRTLITSATKPKIKTDSTTLLTSAANQNQKQTLSTSQRASVWPGKGYAILHSLIRMLAFAAGVFFVPFHPPPEETGETVSTGKRGHLLALSVSKTLKTSRPLAIRSALLYIELLLILLLNSRGVKMIRSPLDHPCRRNFYVWNYT